MNQRKVCTFGLLFFTLITVEIVSAETKEPTKEVSHTGAIVPPASERLDTTVSHQQSLEALLEKSEQYHKNISDRVDTVGVDLARAEGTQLRTALQVKCSELQSKDDDSDETLRERCEDARGKIDSAMNSLPNP